jgi:cellulose synthase/poly-beta-1,6-N-acetylglucosamine synthase-like glycosyltransferase
MELILRLRRAGYEQGGPRRVAFIPDPVAWTEVPESLRDLGRQRDRWHRGLADALWRHKRLLFNPRYGALGMVVLPHFVFVELLAPVMEALGLLGLTVALILGGVNLWFAALFFLGAYGLGMLLTLAAITLEQIGFHRHRRLRDQLKLILWGSLENFGYRQLAVLWRLRGLFNYLRRRTDWGEMERRGFEPAPPVSPGATIGETEGAP